MATDPRFLASSGRAVFSGNEALVKGALETDGGVGLMTGYPGSPVAGFFDVLSDIGELGELEAVEAQLADLLAEEDVVNLAAAMEPGSTAGVLIWENLWAAPFASAARRSGGQLIANGRIPIQAIIASIEADEASATEGE